LWHFSFFEQIGKREREKRKSRKKLLKLKRKLFTKKHLWQKNGKRNTFYNSNWRYLLIYIWHKKSRHVLTVVKVNNNNMK
jgi:hypothetical protein